MGDPRPADPAEPRQVVREVLDPIEVFDRVVYWTVAVPNAIVRNGAPRAFVPTLALARVGYGPWRRKENGTVPNTAGIQVGIIHLSDLHFGAPHYFQPPITPGGSRAANTFPPLSRFLADDLNNPDFKKLTPQIPKSEGNFQDMPLYVVISGDLTQTSGPTEFAEAHQFIADLSGASILGSSIKRENVFVVPGNHDLIYAEDDLARRWFPYCDFYEKHMGTFYGPGKPQALTRVIDRSMDGMVIAEINSAAYVQKGTPEEVRGQVDDESLFKLKTELKKIDTTRLRDAVRVAIMHHHPIVLPALAEPKRGYDAIVNADALLALLQEFEFHVIFHGHKHYPHTFSYDARCAWTKATVWPIHVIAGGSAGSSEIPARDPASTNTYNYVTLKWDPVTRLSRIRIVTRGLDTHDADGRRLLPAEWHFQTLRVDDRVSGAHMPDGNVPYHESTFVPDGHEDRRKAAYAELRWNMPVVEVMPSLIPGQAYEARVWIVPHVGNREVPVRVEWAAGEHFTVVTCDAQTNPMFCATLAYYGPVLVQARMHFADGHVALGHNLRTTPEQRGLNRRWPSPTGNRSHRPARPRPRRSPVPVVAWRIGAGLAGHRPRSWLPDEGPSPWPGQRRSMAAARPRPAPVSRPAPHS